MTEPSITRRNAIRLALALSAGALASCGSRNKSKEPHTVHLAVDEDFSTMDVAETSNFYMIPMNIFDRLFETRRIDGEAKVVNSLCESHTMADDARHFDFVLGSVHFVNEQDIYYKEFWQNKTVEQAVALFLEETLKCVEHHDGYDVLGHLSYICKARAHPDPKPLYYRDHREIVDEIMKILVRKGKGMEINTSGVDRCGDFLPTEEFFRRFKELGGEIVTIGSDAHNAERVGQYSGRACQMMKDIFGYVCTFEDRKPIFHKL